MALDAGANVGGEKLNLATPETNSWIWRRKRQSISS